MDVVGTSWNTTCHCGAVSVRLAKAPEELAECNCSLCFSHGILWAYYSPRDVVIEGETRTFNRADRADPLHEPLRGLALSSM
jgi:hypothetical protein